MDCQLADVFAALAGETPVDERMVRPPANFGRGATRFLDGKGIYGENLAYHLEGENFTVQWSDPDIDPARAAAILDQLEIGWTVLVEHEGWPAPDSSESWLLWVILDPTLAGSGYTTVYDGDAGEYPVSYLNPDYGQPDYPDYALSVAVHEFGHMLQYRLRDWRAGTSDTWHWEATSEWLAELAAPDIDTYALSTYWYAERPEYSFDSIRDYHQYGMLLLDAWLDQEVGPNTVRDVWLAGEGNDTAWDELIATEAGMDFGQVLGAMVGSIAAHTLRESDLYAVPSRVRSYHELPTEDSFELPEKYGSYYMDFDTSAPGFWVAGPVDVVFAQDGAWTTTPPQSGAFTAVFTATERSGELTFGWAEPEVEEPVIEEEEEPTGCGCRSAGPGAGIVGAGLAMWAVGARRRLPPAGSCASSPDGSASARRV